VIAQGKSCRRSDASGAVVIPAIMSAATSSPVVDAVALSRHAAAGNGVGGAAAAAAAAAGVGVRSSNSHQELAAACALAAMPHAAFMRQQHLKQASKQVSEVHQQFMMRQQWPASAGSGGGKETGDVGGAPSSATTNKSHLTSSNSNSSGSAYAASEKSSERESHPRVELDAAAAAAAAAAVAAAASVSLHGQGHGGVAAAAAAATAAAVNGGLNGMQQQHSLASNGNSNSGPCLAEVAADSTRSLRQKGSSFLRTHASKHGITNASRKVSLWQPATPT